MEIRFDVFGMCNALYDLQAEVHEEQLVELGISKGAMTLLTEAEQQAIVPRIYTQLVHTQAGGSGANTMIGVAQMGGTACFTSRVGEDEHGRLYAESLAERGVQPNLAVAPGETGISLILITPDAQRTMGTYLGASQGLHPDDLRLDDLRASRYLYVTGYLWDTPPQKAAVLQAMAAANEAGVKVAFSLSDPFCVARHRDDFLALLDRHVDVVFANRLEAQQLVDEADPRAAARVLAARTGGLAAVTCDAEGSVLARGDERVAIPVYPVTPVDTTGAGDMYAAGILHGLIAGLSLEGTGRIASYAAAQVVAHLGPRLETIDREAIAVLGREF